MSFPGPDKVVPPGELTGLAAVPLSSSPATTVPISGASRRISSTAGDAAPPTPPPFGGRGGGPGKSEIRRLSSMDAAALPPFAGRLSPTTKPAEEGAGINNLESVKFGDIIYLKGTSKVDGGDKGFVYADPCFGKVGFIKDEVSATEELSEFHSCLFVILPQLNYESASTRKELRRRSSFSGGTAEMDMVDIRIEQEKIQNAQTVDRCKKCDESVLYGQVVQLMHVATGKYLMGDRHTSQCQRDCLALSVGQGEEVRMRKEKVGKREIGGAQRHTHTPTNDPLARTTLSLRPVALPLPNHTSFPRASGRFPRLLCRPNPAPQRASGRLCCAHDAREVP